MTDASHFSHRTLATLGIGMVLAIAAGPAMGQFPQFKLENPNAGYITDQLGSSVAVDGDTVVLGAAHLKDPATGQSGIAEVYVNDGAGQWALQGVLAASDAANDLLYGVSVAISGDTAIVGSPSESNGTVSSGVAYVFTRSNGVWTQQERLTPSEAATGDHFGCSVSISGDTAVVGAYGTDSSVTLFDSGAAYVFTRAGGVWTQQAKLADPVPRWEGDFGFDVAVSNGTILVGAPGFDPCSVDPSLTYVFTQSGSAWALQAQLTPSDPAYGDGFGASVSISGDTALVGSPERNDGIEYSGCAYVFTRDGSTWTQQAKLVVSNPKEYDGLGGSVSVHGNTAVIGAPAYDHGVIFGGFASVFTRNGIVWTEQAKLTPSGSAAAEDVFSGSVSISGDTVVVGAPQHDGADWHSGSAFVFFRDGTVWNQQATVNSLDAAENNEFGLSVSVSGDTALVGSPYDSARGLNAGAVYAFAREGSSWGRPAKLFATDAKPEDFLGRSVSISGDTAVASAIYRRVSSSAYVFTRSGGVWTQQARLTDEEDPQGCTFGRSVAVSGDTVVVGAEYDYYSVTHPGSVYVFTREGTTWTLQQRLEPPDSELENMFGHSVAISGDTLVVGTCGGGQYEDSVGMAYVFVRVGTSWTLQGKLVPLDSAGTAYFANTVSVSGDTVIVGAQDDDEAGPDSGAAYVFTRSGDVWTRQAKLISPNPAENSYFGFSVSISCNTLIIGARDTGARAASLSVFTRHGSTWLQQAELTSIDHTKYDGFGVALAIDTDQIIVGAPYKSDPETYSGAAYVFDLHSLATPVVVSFSINQDAATTTDSLVTLNNDCVNSPTEFLASENADFAGADWQPYSPTPDFTLSTGYGSKTIYFKTGNALGESPTVSDTILLEPPPIEGVLFLLR